MGRRGPNGEPFPHWHYRRLTLPDGDELQWVLIDTPSPPHVDAFRLASRGAVPTAEAMELLRAAGHPDADLDARIVPSFADPRGLSLGFISGIHDPTS